MVKINSAFLQNITENLPALSQAEIGNLSARAVYRIAMAPGIEQQECAAKVHELSERAIAATTAVQPNLIAKFFQRIKNLLGSSHRWKTDHQLLSLVWEKLQLLPAGVFAITKAAAEVAKSIMFLMRFTKIYCKDSQRKRILENSIHQEQ